MNFVITFLIFVIALFVRVESILNGSFISIKEAPYYVSLLANGYTSFCGGSILSEYWIITAAHCIDPSSALRLRNIRSGESTDRTKKGLYEVERTIIHGNYDESAISVVDHDVALIKLKTPIKFNEYQQPIKVSPDPPKIGDKLLISGLGDQGKARSTARVLKQTTGIVIDQEDCEEKMLPNVPSGRTFCAENRETDTCSGDSGGPAVINNKLAGVVSWGPTCGTEEDTAGVYTRLHLFYDWIIKHAGLKYDDSSVQ